LVLAYAEQLRQLGADAKAEEVLRGRSSAATTAT
jgi:hypothetical protein